MAHTVPHILEQLRLWKRLKNNKKSSLHNLIPKIQMISTPFRSSPRLWGSSSWLWHTLRMSVISAAALPQNSLMHPSRNTQRVSNMFLLSPNMHSDIKNARNRSSNKSPWPEKQSRRWGTYFGTAAQAFFKR